MVDTLGFRMKFGVVAPSTNTSVQPEFDAMRPHGVTNHYGRIHIPDDPIGGSVVQVEGSVDDDGAIRKYHPIHIPHQLEIGLRLKYRPRRAGDDPGGIIEIEQRHSSADVPPGDGNHQSQV